MSKYYLITVKSLERRIYGTAPTKGYVHASNGVEVLEGMSNSRFGVINIAENGLKPCTQQEAEQACWDVLGVRPDSSWDVFNGCYRIDMKDMEHNIVTPKPMKDMVRIHNIPEENLIRYFEKNRFSIINL